MRVFECAKKFEVSSKEVLRVLAAKGIEVKSHLSHLDSEAESFLEKHFAKTPPASGGENEKLKSDMIQKDTQSPSRSKKNIVASIKKEAPVVTPQASRPSVAPRPHKAEKAAPVVVEKPTSLVIEPMTVVDIAQKIHMPVNELIVSLLRLGIVAPKNQLINEEMVLKIARHFQLEPVRSEVVKKKDSETKIVVDASLQERAPIVAVLGHVDHGKTTLLDYIRKTRVAAREKCGITKHLGAYEATTPHGNIVFLDTPGHEAFSKIRQRGVRVADVVILVVAADDGIMPQTIEAIKHIKAMNAPTIVAVTKIDKVEPSRLEVIKRELAQQDMLPEDWGGQTVMVPVSAITGQNIDKLLEMVILQSQLLELRADQTSFGRGYVLESMVEKGRGFVATIICPHGKIAVGDYFICGNSVGHVTSLVNSYGSRIQESLPPTPVQVAGFESLPEVGDFFEVVSKEHYLKSRTDFEHRNKAVLNRGATNKEALYFILKADNYSTQEALMDAIARLSAKSPVELHIVQGSIGSVSESDVELAFNTGAQIIGLHVKVQTTAAELARQRGVKIELYDIIYKLLEALEQRSIAAQKVKMIQKKIGEAIVRRVFDIKGIGVIAGFYLQDGYFARDGFVKVYRGKEFIGEGSITSLQRDKKTVKEVRSGFEGAIKVENVVDFQEEDRIECYIEVPEQKA